MSKEIKQGLKELDNMLTLKGAIEERVKIL